MILGRRRLALAVGVVVVLGGRATAEAPRCDDPCNLHVTEEATLRSDGGAELRLPPGYYLDEPSRDALDVEVARLQEDVTRLRAENESLRASARGSGLSWWTLASLAVGIAGGAYAWERWVD